MADLDIHAGPVKLLQMDVYKIVTGGPDDSNVNVWEAETSTLSNSLMCLPSDMDAGFGCSAMAVQRCRIVTASSGGQVGLLRYRDFNNACYHVSSDSCMPASKFWDQQSSSDSEESHD